MKSISFSRRNGGCYIGWLRTAAIRFVVDAKAVARAELLDTAKDRVGKSAGDRQENTRRFKNAERKNYRPALGSKKRPAGGLWEGQ